MNKVRVKQKGQVTIPQELRTKLGIEEGAILEITSQGNTIMLKPTPPIEIAEPVSEEEQKRLLNELEKLRRNWR